MCGHIQRAFWIQCLPVSQFTCSDCVHAQTLVTPDYDVYYLIVRWPRLLGTSKSECVLHNPFLIYVRALDFLLLRTSLLTWNFYQISTQVLTTIRQTVPSSSVGTCSAESASVLAIVSLAGLPSTRNETPKVYFQFINWI